MRRLITVAALASMAMGCPEPIEGPMGAVQGTNPPPPNEAPMGASPGAAPSGALPPPNVGTSDKLVAPPGAPGVPADQLQRAIGALNQDALAVKQSILDYVEKNGSGGKLTFDDGQGGTVAGQYVRTHDPVRYKDGKGYIALSDFQVPGAAAEAFYQLAFWVKKDGDNVQVFEVDLQAFPAQRNGEWVRLELFTVNDSYAKPLQ
jgi:hypothetical protein